MIRKGILMGVFVILIVFLASCGGDSKKEESSLKDDLQGDWHGAIEIPGQPLKIALTLNVSEELSGTISIPIQGMEDYPLSKVKLDDDHIVFTMDAQGDLVSFDGNVKEDSVEGTFEQQGQTFPFKLEKGELERESDEGEFLSVETRMGTIQGELEQPKGDGPHPVMLIIPGSGPTDRNGNTVAGENNSLKYVAKRLAEHGIASIRYDKPGAGKNAQPELSEKELTFDDYANNAVAWIQLLKEDDRFSHVGVIGHSQGSLEAILAAEKVDVDVFISLAGAGNSIDEVLYHQLEAQLSVDLLDESKAIIEDLKQGNYVKKMSEELESVFRPSVQPFLVSWMEYTPTEEIAALDIPILVVNGENDLQVPEKEAKLLQKAGKDTSLLLLSKMNHVLKDAPEDRAGNLATYSNPDKPLSDGLIDGMMDFLEEKHFLSE